MLASAGLVGASLGRLAGLPCGRLIGLAALRAGIVAPAALAAAGPVCVRQGTVAEPAPVLVALDASRSLALPHMPGAATRREAVSRLLAWGGLLARWAA
jgi:hypothetical protein